MALFQRQADVVQAVKQAMLFEGIDIELDDTSIRAADFLLFQIDGDRGVGAATGVIHQLVEVFLADDDRQNAVLEAVVVEDVGEAGGDHAADAEVEKRPWGVLARGAAAEIVACDEDGCIAPCGLIEHEIRVSVCRPHCSALPRTGPFQDRYA
jgi:hypothetical protein